MKCPKCNKEMRKDSADGDADFPYTGQPYEFWYCDDCDIEVGDKIELTFLTDFIELMDKIRIKDAVRIKIIDPEAIFLTGILGESGRKMVNAGIHFWFTRELADKLIAKGIAIEEPPSDKIILIPMANPWLRGAKS